MQSRTIEDLITFVNSKCMTFRTVGGALSELAGRMPLLDTLASKFFMAKEDSAKQSVWQETKAYVERVSQSANATEEKNIAAQYYIKVSEEEWHDYKKRSIRIDGNDFKSGNGQVAQDTRIFREGNEEIRVIDQEARRRSKPIGIKQVR